MFDKPAPLPDIHPLTLSGADAVRFAQAQFMNDVTALPAWHWQWNGWLTPKGRVVALFALLKRAEDEVLVLLLDADPAEFCAALGRFVFRSKVKIAPCPALSVMGCFATPKQARGNLAAELDEGALELDFSAEGGARTLLLNAVESFSAPGEPLPTPHSHLWGGGQEGKAFDLRWRHFDLVHGLPRLNPGQAGQWTPQQLSLDRLSAYSVKKGCYPGQEIVARTHFLGQAKRGLVRLTTAHAIDPTGVEVNEAPPVPLITCAGNDALAVLSLDAAPDTRYRIGGHPGKRQPLLGGLAR